MKLFIFLVAVFVYSTFAHAGDCGIAIGADYDQKSGASTVFGRENHSVVASAADCFTMARSQVSRSANHTIHGVTMGVSSGDSKGRPLDLISVHYMGAANEADVLGVCRPEGCTHNVFAK